MTKYIKLKPKTGRDQMDTDRQIAMHVAMRPVGPWAQGPKPIHTRYQMAISEYMALHAVARVRIREKTNKNMKK